MHLWTIKQLKQSVVPWGKVVSTENMEGKEVDTSLRALSSFLSSYLLRFLASGLVKVGFCLTGRAECV